MIIGKITADKMPPGLRRRVMAENRNRDASSVDISSAFIWISTKEGVLYWSDLYNKRTHYDGRFEHGVIKLL